MPEQNDSWHLDKRVPISLIVAIVIQTSAFIYFAGQLSTRVDHLEQAVSESKNRGERISRLEAGLEAVKDVAVRIENKLDRWVRVAPN